SSSTNIKEVSVKTEDGVLSLTRLFTLNEKLEGRLIVRNDSQHPVSLQSVIFRIFIAEKSVGNDSRHPVKTPSQSHFLRSLIIDQPCDKKNCPFCDGNCVEYLGYGTDCFPGACPPPDEKPNIAIFPPEVSVAKVSSSEGHAITFSWRGQNIPSNSLLPK